MKYLIGVDIGTQATKATLFDGFGTILAEAVEQSNLIIPEPGSVTQDPDEVFASVIRTIKHIVEVSGVDAKAIAAMAFDGQMAGIMGVGESYEAVTYYDSWLDTRCEKYIAHMKQVCNEPVIRITGGPITYAHGPKILWWKHERPDVYARISKFVMLHGFVAGRLCGLSAEDAFIDYTNLHFTGFADNKNKRWSKTLMDEFGVEESKLPEIVEPWRVVGGVKEEYAKQCGLVSGTPVMAGCGDSAANSLGAGIVRVGQVFDVAGTASIFSFCVDTFAPDIKHAALMQMRSVIDGLWQPLAYINGGGLCVRWFKDLAASDYGALEARAAQLPPGAQGIVFNPHFAGRVCPNNPDVKGSFIGLSWNHTQGHLYRAIMEGIAYEYRYYLDVLRDNGLGQAPMKVFAMGGGAKSELFNKIKADVLNLEYHVMKNNDTATLGCALVAGFGAGLFSDIAQTIENIVEIQAVIHPNKENHAAYRPYYEAYKAQFEALKSVYGILKNIN